MSAQTTRCSGTRRYKVEHAWLDVEVTLDVDHRLLTPELAKDINEYWTDAEQRLEAADGDVVVAVIKMAGAAFLGMVLDVRADLTEYGMQKEFDKMEAWDSEVCGIRLVDFDGRPDLESEELRVTELEV
ncbi:DUF2528 family protein [Stenotrophomonas sp. G106K1]|uniref:DUF2528 family protein n=1 Tax=Stenotrophomonas sp. G106K1 TaxID=3134792 RepID=UPI0030F44A6C